MNKKTTITLLVIVAIAVIGIVLATGGTETIPNDNATTTPGQNGDQQTSIPDSWQTYENESFDFTFRYPENATTTVENERVKVQVIGPDAQENTELTDGFTLYINQEDIPADTDLESVAQNQHEEETQRLESAQEPIAVTIDGREGYEFQVQTELGSIAHHVIVADDAEDRAFHVTYIISGDDDGSYQETVDDIISTLSSE